MNSDEWDKQIRQLLGTNEPTQEMLAENFSENFQLSGPLPTISAQESREIWQVDMNIPTAPPFQTSHWDPTLNEFMPPNSSLSAFHFLEQEQQQQQFDFEPVGAQDDIMPDRVRNIMDQAMSNQLGAGSSFNQLLFEEEGAEEVAEEEDDEEEQMIQMDLDLGPQDDPRLFKNLPHYNPSSHMSKKAKRRRRKRGVLKAYPALPEHVSELMQAANMKYIEGENAQAIEILREVIRERADAHEAWLTLGMIYNSQNDSNKMLQCKMMAAHLSKTNGDLWKSLGFTSKEMGHNEQSLYCFKRAHRVDKNDLECVFEISHLSSLLGDTTYAQSGFEKILEVAPLERECIKELAKIYLQKKKIPEAIELFERLLNADELDPLPDLNEDDGLDDLLGGNELQQKSSIKPQRMGYEELNMVSELYFEISEGEKALKTLHRGICRLHGLDFHSISPSDYDNHLLDLPVELRVKMGICFILMDKPDEAKSHLNILYSLENAPTSYPELYFDIGDFYMKKNQFKNALDVFLILLGGLDANESLEVQRKIAECHIELGNIDDSIMVYESILRIETNNTKLQNKLIQLLEENGQREKATVLQKEFLRTRALHKSKNDEEDEDEEIHQTLFTHKEGKKTAQKRKYEEEKIRKVEDQARQDAETCQLYNRMMTLSSRLNIASSRSEYFLLAKQMMLVFSKVDRVRLRSKETESIVGIKRVAFVEEGKGWNTPAGNSINQNPHFDEELCGITYRQWYFLLINVTLEFAKDGKYEDAYQVMKHSLECQTFYNDERRKFELQMILVAISVSCKEFEQAGYISRNFCFVGPYLITGLRLYTAVFCGGPRAIQSFSLGLNTKFLYRQVDKLQKMINDNPESVSPKNAAILFGTYGHAVFCSKSYAMAISFYLKALNYSPNDPVLYLSAGIAYMHRATQKTESRHGHLIKGFSFFSRYRELKGFDVESDYNLARAFHHFSLYHLAIPYYEKVIKNKRQFVREAAYNLSAIYMSVGSPHLAKQVMKENWLIRC